MDTEGKKISCYDPDCGGTMKIISDDALGGKGTAHLYQCNRDPSHQRWIKPGRPQISAGGRTISGHFRSPKESIPEERIRAGIGKREKYYTEDFFRKWEESLRYRRKCKISLKPLLAAFNKVGIEVERLTVGIGAFSFKLSQGADSLSPFIFLLGLKSGETHQLLYSDFRDFMGGLERVLDIAPDSFENESEEKRKNFLILKEAWLRCLAVDKMD